MPGQLTDLGKTLSRLEPIHVELLQKVERLHREQNKVLIRQVQLREQNVARGLELI
jgi:hypothetical protein